MKKEPAKEIAAWRVSAPKGCDCSFAFSDEVFSFEAVKPGDPLLLLNDSGDGAWGARRVFLVRRESGCSIVYFDRALDFDREIEIPFAGSGDKRVLRRIDLDDFVQNRFVAEKEVCNGISYDIKQYVNINIQRNNCRICR